MKFTRTFYYYSVILLLTITSSLFGQIRFEKGYFIDNENHKTECLIKNMDWRFNPVEFEYKLGENEKLQKGTLETVKEFNIIGFLKYMRADVKIDLSGDLMDNLNEIRDPVWSQERLFLKVLIEGEVSLYYYEDGAKRRYFYSIADAPAQQLIWKKFLVKGRGYIGTNYSFRQQLWNDVRCPNAPISSVENIDYNRSELEKYFIKYNECTGHSIEVYNDNKKKRNSFHLKIAPGINYSSISFDSNSTSWITDFDHKINFRIGLEAEYILPFNNNKWAILLEPTYQYYNSEKQLKYFVASIKYSSVTFPIGVRYYFILNSNTKLFLNAEYIHDMEVDFNSTILLGSYRTFEINSRNNMAIGGGINFKRISGEIRYYSKRDLLKNTNALYANYMCWSFIIGYRLF